MAEFEVAYVSQLLDDHESRDKTTSQSMMLYDFRKEVEAAIPGCRTTPRNNDKWCWVYMPDDHVAMGAIGYGNFTNNSRAAFTYTVHARTVVNGKYSYHSKQHNMVMTTNLSVAVKNAKKYLRRYSPKELMEQTRKFPRDKIQGVRTNLRSEVNKQEVLLFGGSLPNRDSSPMLTELRHLLNSGHAFLTDTVPTRLTEYFNLLAEDKHGQQGYNMDFVAISKVGERMRFDVIPVDKMDNHWPTAGELQTYYEDVPEHTLGRVAVLNMVEDGGYVPGVGYRHTERMFYVVR